MANQVNPLILRSKIFPFYKNNVNCFYNLKSGVYSVLMCLKKGCPNYYLRIKCLGFCVFFVIKSIGDRETGLKNSFSIKHLLTDTKKKWFTIIPYWKILLFNIKSLLLSVEYLISFILNRIKYTQGTVRKIIMNVALLLFNEYKIRGFRSIVSGRVKGEQRSKTEVFNFGVYSTSEVYTVIKYGYSYINTKYGVLGVRVWLFI